MPILRPAAADNDDFLSKIIKYIPAEIIAVYTAIAGILKSGLDATLPAKKNVDVYFAILVGLLVVTPVWTYFAVLDNPNIKEPPSKKKRAVFHAVIATVAFAIWVYAIGDILFKSWLCGCYFDDTMQCLAQCGKYNSIAAGVILILFTGLLVPLLERIVLGKPAPAPL